MDLDKMPEVKHVLVIVDHFTRYMRACVTKDQKAFTSEVVTELCTQFGVEKTTMTPYHPQGNGQVEQAHQTLGNMIRKLGG